MLDTNRSELRTRSPSLLMRAVVWLISRRAPVFPDDPGEYERKLSHRAKPRDAPMPPRFETRYRTERWEAAGRPVITLHPRSGVGAWHMIYLHGGGFVLPMFKEHWPLAAALVDQLGLSVTLPLYDVVPESDAAGQDALADAVFAELAGRHDPSRIVLCGDSAGGHMALSLALRLGARGGPQAGRLALFAPWLDLVLADPAIEAIAPHDVMLKIDTLRVCGAMFAGERDPAAPECSPLRASSQALAALPPTRIWTGRHDLFIVDSRSFAERLGKAGVDARLYEYEGAPHVFMAITPTREAKDVFALLRGFLED